MTTEALRLAKKVAAAENIAEARAAAERVLAAAAARAKRVGAKAAPRRKAEKEKEEAERAFYVDARSSAFARSGVAGIPHCEAVHLLDGQEVRCDHLGGDSDHILSGAMRAECGRLGAEGLMILCRTHHDLKHASSPTREFWLDQAEAHALRHGYKRLLGLVRKARAKYEGKHPQQGGAR